ncbi:inorganic phosphate transporter [Thermophagus sp. OGC60D27]|uniref:inorganic phosphate transporter n=1 Tax=Thermophagus sp. OGC60D27 TaxID=3458415 RepID=UPI004037D4B0
MTLVWIIAILLSLLAIVDLVVGVSNDAVNFLNSAIGSRVAPRRAIYWVAGSGIIVGTFFSAGMMEVARQGVIYPHHFYLTELMVIFLAVMIIDIILIDIYNTIGFPTSTTIAVVFELTGAALAMAIIKSKHSVPDEIILTDFINTGRVFMIFSGILVSIIVSFIIGAGVQFITRLLFGFNKRGHSGIVFLIFGALSISLILYIIIKKGLEAWPTLDLDILYQINFYSEKLFFLVFAITLLLLLFSRMLFQADLPQIVVMTGTFALALSFAANDLVNFIGIPLAGIESFKAFLISDGGNVAEQFGLDFLTNEWLRNHRFGDSIYAAFFLLSGIVMVLTLFYSKKVRTVTETEVYLGRQQVGQEHFEPSQLSRTIVRNFLILFNKIDNKLPKLLHRFISSRYKQTEPNSEDQVIYFDTIRATVNLIVASILISIGTYWSVPLSTTFVVFMVAMGTSLADQAWGRESAVYRISGVLSILGGWFITAFLGFLGAFFLTLLIWWGTWVSITVSIALTVIYLIKSTQYHKTRHQEQEQYKQKISNKKAQNIEWLRKNGSDTVRKLILESSKIYMLLVKGVLEEEESELIAISQKAGQLKRAIQEAKTDFFSIMAQIPEETQDSGQFFIQALDYLTELGNTLTALVDPAYIHFKNQHKGLTNYQKEDLNTLLDETTTFFNYMVHLEKDKKYVHFPELIQRQEALFSLIENFRLHHIRKIRLGAGKTRINILYLEFLGETRNLILYSVNLVKSMKNFFES